MRRRHRVTDSRGLSRGVERLAVQLLIWLGLFLITAFSACSGSGGMDSTAPPAGAAVTVSPASASVTLGATFPLQAQVRDKSGAVIPNATVFWSTSDSSVATVSSAGVVTAKAVGHAQIAASANGSSAVAAIDVVQVPVATVTVAPSTGTINVGGTLTLQAMTSDASGAQLTGRGIVWATSAPQVAMVSSSGVVTGVAAGTATISATSEGKSGTARITVAVVPVASVSVSPSSASLTVGQTASLTATTLDANGNVLVGRAVTWSSSNTSVATVSTQGLVTAVGSGSANVIATSEGKSGSAQIVVAQPPPPVAHLTISPPAATIARGTTLDFTAHPTDASGKTVTGVTVNWSVSDTTVATIRSTGATTATLTAQNKRGTVTVTAAVATVSATAAVVVQ